MSSRVLEFFRQQDERFRGVPDAELTGFVAETYPDFLQDEEFLRSVKGYQQQGKLSKLRSEMQAVEADAGRLLGPQTGEKLADIGSRYVLEPVANIPATIGNLPAMAGKAVGLIPEEAPLPFERGKPVVSLPRFDQQEGDGKIKQYAKGAANALAGVAESLTTPENMMALPAAAAGAVTRGVAETAFAGIMAGMVPEAAQAAGEASVTGTPMEKAEAYTGLGAMAGLVAAPVPGMARRATEAGVLPVSKGEMPKVAARALDSAVKQGPAGNIGRPVTPILARIENIAETAPATAEVLKQVQTDVAKLPEGTPTELKPPVAPEPEPVKAAEPEPAKAPEPAPVAAAPEPTPAPEPVAEPRPTTLAELATYDVEAAAMKALEAEKAAEQKPAPVEAAVETKPTFQSDMELLQGRPTDKTFGPVTGWLLTPDKLSKMPDSQVLGVVAEMAKVAQEVKGKGARPVQDATYRVQLASAVAEAKRRGLDVPDIPQLKDYGLPVVNKDAPVPAPDITPETKSQGLQVRRALENNRNRTEGGFIAKEVFEDIVNLGRRLFRPGIDFASWSAAMVKSAGHRVKEFLEDAWDYIKGTLTSYDPDSGAYIANATRRKALQVIRGTAGALPKSIRDQQRITSGHRQATEERAMVLARDVRAAAEAAFPDAPDRGTSVVDDALSGRAPLSSLPTTRLQHSVAVLRQFIDSMSLAVASNPAVSETLGNAIKANLGSYWKRAYLAFDPEADWNYDSIVRKIKRGDADAKRRFDNMRDFLKRRNPEWDEGRIEAEMRSLVDRATEMTSGRAPEATTREWASNVSSLMQRKDLPIEVREWLGEITDPYAKVAVTAKWMAQFLARQDSMQVIADTGLRTGLFSKEKTGRYSEQVYPDELDLRAVKGDDGKPLTTEEKQIVAEFFVRTDKAHHPLRNLYTTKEMAAALREFESPNGGLPSVLSVLGRLWSGSVGLMKKGQVPLNPGSWNVNILGGVGINLVGGHWNPMLYKAAFRAIRHGGKARGDRPTTAEIKKAREDYMLAVRQGLTDAGVLQSEIRELSQAAIGGESPKKAWERVQEAFRSRQAPSVKDMAKAAWHLTDIPGELFISKPDNMFRMANFMGNLEVATKAFPGMTPEQRIAWATERATNTYQTYSKLPQSIRDLSKAGLLNTYIQFKVELMRNTFWVARYAMQDMRSGNPVLMKNGAKAMAGLTGVFAATYFLTGISRDASDLTPEQEEALRLFLAPWDRNEPLFHVGRDGNTFSYSPVSYLVPHAEFSKIVSAAAHSLDDPDRAMQELGQLASDYFGPSSMTKPMVEAVANKRLDSGDEITRKEGSDGVKDRLNYFFQSTMVPRMYTMARDTIRGVMGIPGDYGKVNKPEDALLKMAAVRVRNVDMDRAVFFKLRELERRWQGARSEELKAERRWKDFPDKVAEAKAYAESKKQQLLVEYKKHVVAAKLLGVTDETIGKAERDLSIPKQLRAARWSEE